MSLIKRNEKDALHAQQRGMQTGDEVFSWLPAQLQKVRGRGIDLTVQHVRATRTTLPRKRP